MYGMTKAEALPAVQRLNIFQIAAQCDLRGHIWHLLCMLLYFTPVFVTVFVTAAAAFCVTTSGDWQVTWLVTIDCDHHEPGCALIITVQTCVVC
jgi:hypothetical protein